MATEVPWEKVSISTHDVAANSPQNVEHEPDRLGSSAVSSALSHLWVIFVLDNREEYRSDKGSSYLLKSCANDTCSYRYK
jgi:hypothetical protein